MTREWNPSFYPHQQDGIPPKVNPSFTHLIDLQGKGLSGVANDGDFGFDASTQGLRSDIFSKRVLAVVKGVAERISISHEEAEQGFSQLAAIVAEIREMNLQGQPNGHSSTEPFALSSSQKDFSVPTHAEIHSVAETHLAPMLLQGAILEDELEKEGVFEAAWGFSWPVIRFLILKILSVAVGLSNVKAFERTLWEVAPETMKALGSAIKKLDFKAVWNLIARLLQHIASKKFAEALAKRLGTRVAGETIARILGKWLPLVGWLVLAAEMLLAIIAEAYEKMEEHNRYLREMNARQRPQQPPSQPKCGRIGVSIALNLPYFHNTTQYDSVIRAELIRVAREKARVACKDAICPRRDWPCRFVMLDESKIPAIRDFRLVNWSIHRPANGYIPPGLENVPIQYWMQYQYTAHVYCECDEIYRHSTSEYAQRTGSPPTTPEAPGASNVVSRTSDPLSIYQLALRLGDSTSILGGNLT